MRYNAVTLLFTSTVLDVFTWYFVPMCGVIVLRFAKNSLLGNWVIFLLYLGVIKIIFLVR